MSSQLEEFGYPVSSYFVINPEGVRVQAVDKTNRYVVELVALDGEDNLRDDADEEYFLEPSSKVGFAAWDHSGEISFGPTHLIQHFRADPALAYGRVMTVADAVRIYQEVLDN